MMDYLRSESEHITYLLEAFEIPETREGETSLICS